MASAGCSCCRWFQMPFYIRTRIDRNIAITVATAQTGAWPHPRHTAATGIQVAHRTAVQSHAYGRYGKARAASALALQKPKRGPLQITHKGDALPIAAAGRCQCGRHWHSPYISADCTRRQRSQKNARRRLAPPSQLPPSLSLPINQRLVLEGENPVNGRVCEACTALPSRGSATPGEAVPGLDPWPGGIERGTSSAVPGASFALTYLSEAATCHLAGQYNGHAHSTAQPLSGSMPCCALHDLCFVP